jgi:hypothetical protein
MVAVPNQLIRDNLNNVGCGISRISGTKQRQYLKDKINELETNCKN